MENLNKSKTNTLTPEQEVQYNLELQKIQSKRDLKVFLSNLQKDLTEETNSLLLLKGGIKGNSMVSFTGLCK